MGDEKGDRNLTGNIDLVYQLICKGIRIPELRDELFCQLVKQTNNNPNLLFSTHIFSLSHFYGFSQSYEKGFQLMCALLDSFRPTSNFEGYLLHYLESKTRETEGFIPLYACYCWRLLRDEEQKEKTSIPSRSHIKEALVSKRNECVFVSDFVIRKLPLLFLPSMLHLKR